MAVVHKLNSALVTFTGILSIMLVLTQPAWSDSSVPHDFVDGQPATASEVNENFTAILEAIDDHWTRHPDRYYPDWRYDPGFYLTLPTLGGFWKGRLLSRLPFALHELEKPKFHQLLRLSLQQLRKKNLAGNNCYPFR